MDHHYMLQLLQDISIEKWGLHNFIEHLDLAMYELPDEEILQKLKHLREISQRDYDRVKELVEILNDHHQDTVSPDPFRRSFTVGTLQDS